MLEEGRSSEKGSSTKGWFRNPGERLQNAEMQTQEQGGYKACQCSAVLANWLLKGNMLALFPAKENIKSLFL